MKSILAAIGRAVRAMARASAAFVKKTVVIGGKLVTLFLPAAIPTLDVLEPEDVAPANDNALISENQGIRDLAYCQITGRQPTPAALGAVTDLQVDWVAVMDAEMCCRLLKSSDQDINAHLLGCRIIKGVLAYDGATIEDYALAREIDNARMERDLGLDRPRQPKMPGGM